MGRTPTGVERRREITREQPQDRVINDLAAARVRMRRAQYESISEVTSTSSAQSVLEIDDERLPHRDGVSAEQDETRRALTQQERTRRELSVRGLSTARRVRAREASRWWKIAYGRHA